MHQRASISDINPKIKAVHSIMPVCKDIINHRATMDCIQRIIPGRLYAKKSSNTDTHVRFSYYTTSGLKYTIHHGKVTQEVFITCNENTKEQVYNWIQNEEKKKSNI